MAKVARPRKHGKRWQINYVDATGKRRYRTFATHKEAVSALRKLAAKAEVARESGTAAVQAHRTFAELEGLWTEVKHRKRSLADDESRIRVHLHPAFGHLRLDEITPRKIARFENDLSRRVSTGTVRLVLALLKSMLKLAEEHSWLGRAPKVRLPPAEAKAYSWLERDEDIATLLKVSRETCRSSGG